MKQKLMFIQFILDGVNSFLGKVGTGKTTLIKEYCKLIGVEEIVNMI